MNEKNLLVAIVLAGIFASRSWNDEELATLDDKGIEELLNLAECAVHQLIEGAEGVLADETWRMKIDDADLPVRIQNALVFYGKISTIQQLCERKAKDLLCLKNFGQTSLQQVRDFLKTKNLHLKGESPNE